MDRIPASCCSYSDRGLHAEGIRARKDSTGVVGGGGPKEGQGGLLGGGVAQTHQKDDRSWPGKWESVLLGHRGCEEDQEEGSATTSAWNAKVRSSDFFKKLQELGV